MINKLNSDLYRDLIQKHMSKQNYSMSRHVARRKHPISLSWPRREKYSHNDSRFSTIAINRKQINDIIVFPGEHSYTCKRLWNAIQILLLVITAQQEHDQSYVSCLYHRPLVSQTRFPFSCRGITSYENSLIIYFSVLLRF